MRQLLPLSVLFGGCALADARQERVEPPVELSVVPEGPSNLTPTSPGAAVRGLLAVHDRLAEAPAGESAAWAAASSTLVENCPFNRASMLLPQALLTVVARHPGSTMPAEVQMQWAELRSGLELHVAVLYELGATPPLAQPDAPLGPLVGLLDKTWDIVGSYSDETLATIEGAHAVLRPATEGAWPFVDATRGWREGLRAMRVELGDDHSAASDVDEMISIIDKYLRLSC